MSDRKKHRTANEFLQYLKGGISGRERHSFERDLEADPFSREAMEGFELVSADAAEEDLLTLHSRLKKRETRRRRITWYSMAAAVASILIVGTLFLQIHDFNPIDVEQKEYLKEVPPGEVPNSEPLRETTPPPEKQEVPEKQAIVEEKAERKPMQEEAVQPAPQPVVHQQQKSDEPKEVVVVEAEATPSDELVRSAGESQKKGLVPAEPAFPESSELTGTVISAEDQSPIPGASITMQGDDAVSITDLQGRFTIPMADDSQSTVVASFAGMETEEYVLPAGEEPRLIMQPQAAALQDQAVTGKGKTSRRMEMEAKPSAIPDAQQTDFQPRSPEPSGGYILFYQYISENRQFPLEDGLPDEAVVILRFRITASAEIRDIVPVRSPGEAFTKEAIRLLEEGPQWNPAYDEHGPVDKEVLLRIVLKK